MANNNYSRRNRQKKNKKQKNKFSLRNILLGILALILTLVVIVGGVVIYWIATAPDITHEDMLGTVGATVVDAREREIYKFGGTDRELLEEDEIPQVLKDATLAIEDQRFYDHRGIDPIRLGGAVVANFRDGFGSQGGSTITQQLVKLSVFSTGKEDQNLRRKVQEAWLALQIERDYSKEEILTLYMNKVYMSDNQYGMGTASEYYYGKPASDLQLHEAALLAGMPQSPNGYNPYENPENATNRRNTVLNAMVDYGAITDQEYQETAQIPIETGLTERSFSTSENIAYDAYIKEVIREIESKTDLNPYSSPLLIHTNMDTEAQEYLYQLMNSDQYITMPDEDIQAAISIVNTQNGQVLALYGGDNEGQALGYNRATELERSIGSTMKPLSVYGPAIEYEHYYTGQLIEDSPLSFSDGSELSNFDNQYHGDVTMRRALTDSYNIPAVRTLQDVGLDRAQEFLTRIGIDDLNDGAGLYESNAIGGEVTPMQLSASYAAFGNEGAYTDPYLISHIDTPEGETIDLRPEEHRAMEDYTAYMITDMLKDSARNYNSLTGVYEYIPHALKTGTTNFTDEQRSQYGIPEDAIPDHWTSGYSQNYSVAVWTGYDDYLTSDNYMYFNTPSQFTSSRIFGAVMNYLHSDARIQETGAELTFEDWAQPESVVTISMIPGDPPIRSNAPEARNELFVRSSLGNITFREAPEELEVPGNLTAAYNPETESIDISWSGVEGADSYIVTADGSSAETRSTSHSFTYEGTGGSIQISVRARAGSRQGPAATLTLTLTEIEEDSSDDADSSSGPDESSQPEESSSIPEEGQGEPGEGSGGANPPQEGGSPPRDSNPSENTEGQEDGAA